LDKEKHGAFNLQQRLSNNDASTNSINLTPEELKLQFESEVVKKSATWEVNEETLGLDFWLWQIDGESNLKVLDANESLVAEYNLKKHDSILLHPASLGSIRAEISGNSGHLLKVTQNPKRKQF
jgi:hypothetical protein